MTSLLSNQGLTDLSWLSVDEAEYRKLEALPRQNLDMVPELQRALTMEDGVPHVTVLRPHTIVNRNPSDVVPVSDVNLTAPIRNRVARLMMSGVSPDIIRRSVLLEFSPRDVQIASEEVRKVLGERGVLGNVYVDSNHFPRCSKDKGEQKFARTAGKRALYVLAKSECSGCVHNNGGLCSAIGGKRLVDEVPYGGRTAAHYALELASEKRPMDFPVLGPGIPPVSNLEWKERIRAAFIKAPVQASPDGVMAIVTQQPPPERKPLTREDVKAFWASRTATFEVAAPPSPEYVKLARRMMDGHDDTEMLVACGSPELRQLASEHGLLGHSYLDMDVLGGCDEVLSRIRSGSRPDFVVRRASRCQHCKCLDDGACAEVSRVSTIVDRLLPFDVRSFARALIRAADKGRISMDQARTAARRAAALPSDRPWGQLIARVNLFTPPAPRSAPFSGISGRAFSGASPTELDRSPVDPEELRRSISQLMNTGLSGRSLRAAVLSAWSKRDLVEHPDVGRRLADNDGVQGSHFIDPTAYSDYGRGCAVGSSKFRKQGAPYVLASSGCTGCTLQTAPGWCSRYSKELIRQVPDEVRKAASDARRRLPIVHAPVENPVERFELSSEVSLDVGDPAKLGLDISIAGHSIGD